MKQRVELSTYCWIITILTLVLSAVILWRTLENQILFTVIGILVCLMLILALWYAPMSLSVKDGCLNINSTLRVKSIPLQDIESVKPMNPTMGAIRTCGSGGFLGYWGWFRESDLGRYFAYYGKASDCFLATLKDGRKYMLGCRDGKAFANALSLALKASGELKNY
ncbi:MAG: hypothetical protein HDS68_07295 [Bacteroidales bacterium]|nr:hypothetical protein [Bacteroidales bacterium]